MSLVVRADGAPTTRDCVGGGRSRRSRFIVRFSERGKPGARVLPAESLSFAEERARSVIAAGGVDVVIHWRPRGRWGDAGAGYVSEPQT